MDCAGPPLMLYCTVHACPGAPVNSTSMAASLPAHTVRLGVFTVAVGSGLTTMGLVTSVDGQKLLVVDVRVVYCHVTATFLVRGVVASVAAPVLTL